MKKAWYDMKRTVAFLLALFTLLSLCACSAEEESIDLGRGGGLRLSEGDLFPENFLNFDGKNVSFTEFRYYYLNYRDSYLKEDPDHFKKDGANETLKQEILQVLLDVYSVRQLAAEHKVSLSADEKKAVQEQLDQIAALSGGAEAVAAELEKSYMTEGLYRSMMEYAALYKKLFNTLFQEGGAAAFTDEEFLEYYRQHYLAVQQIFIPYVKGEDKASHEKTLAEIKAVQDKLSAGEDFWELVLKYGKDERMGDYPDGYYITEGQAEDALYEASRALAIGEVSAPTAGETGLYLIRRVELREVRMLENRDTALFGYTDSYNEWHSGAYDDVFYRLYQEKGKNVKIEYSEFWDKVTPESVY